MATAYPGLLEVRPALVVVQGVNGEYLATLRVSQTHHLGHLVILVLELRLIHQDLDI